MIKHLPTCPQIGLCGCDLLGKPIHDCTSNCRREGCPMLDSCYDVNGDCEGNHCRCDEPSKIQEQQKDTEDNSKSLTK